jgi:hypothetical protein
VYKKEHTGCDNAAFFFFWFVLEYTYMYLPPEELEASAVMIGTDDNLGMYLTYTLLLNLHYRVYTAE